MPCWALGSSNETVEKMLGDGLCLLVHVTGFIPLLRCSVFCPLCLPTEHHNPRESLGAFQEKHQALSIPALLRAFAIPSAQKCIV